MSNIHSLAREGVARCCDALFQALQKPGAVVLLPTETVYGLAAKAGDEAAYGRIFQLKQRSAAKVLGWFAGDYRELEKYGVILAGLPEKLCKKYFPGPLTVIAPRRDGTTIGFRSPDFPLLKALLPLTGPLCQTSANLSGNPNPRTLQAALEQLCGEVDCAVDGGSLPENALGSTVVDATGREIKILRQGALKIEDV